MAGITEDSFEPITSRQTVDVRSWLQGLGLALNREEEDAFVLDNPLCNGEHRGGPEGGGACTGGVIAHALVLRLRCDARCAAV